MIWIRREVEVEHGIIADVSSAFAVCLVIRGMARSIGGYTEFVFFHDSNFNYFALVGY